MRHIPCIVIAFATALPGAALAQVRQVDGFAIRELSSRVYLLEGLGVGRSNSVLIVGDSVAMLVDAQLAPSLGRALVRVARGLTTRPIRALVITHWHVDHSHGAAGVREELPDARVLMAAGGADGLPERGADQLARARPFWAGQSNAARNRLAQGAPDPDGSLGAMANDTVALAEMARPRWATPRSVMKREVIDLGRQRVELLPLSGHTDGDLALFLPDEGILVVGDLILPGRAPEPARRVAIEKAWTVLARLPVRWIVPGHGPPLSRSAWSRPPA